MRSLAHVAVVAVLLAAPVARAEEDACFSAPVEGQKLRKDGKLSAALARFASCAQKTCPSEIVADCARWVADVEAALPSVVVAARDAAGHDLTDARVSIDGAPPVPVSVQAIVVDPGSHRLVVSRDGEANVEVNVVAREGEHNREVVAIFAPKKQTPVATVPLAPARMATRPVPVATWISLAGGALSLAAFATVGSMGVAERSADGCATGCTMAQKDDVDLKFHVADVLLGVGIASVIVGFVVYRVRPTVYRAAPPSIAIRF